jgi:predicted RNA binding protein with dsRBD fold (UPF0201 family)
MTVLISESREKIKKGVQNLFDEALIMVLRPNSFFTEEYHRKDKDPFDVT